MQAVATHAGLPKITTPHLERMCGIKNRAHLENLPLQVECWYSILY